MHPKTLLEACSELVRLALKFDHPTDAIIARFYRENKGLGPRERGTMTETVYNVLRKKLLFDHFAPSGSGPKERRLAILGFHGPRDFLKSALSDQEKNWLDQCDSIQVKDLMERHRHNLPEWLVSSLKEQVGGEFWPLVEALSQPGPLDLRINTLKAKRPEVQAELAQKAIKSVVTAFSPWGLRVDGKPSLNKLAGYIGGSFEVQDEGSQLLALLLDAKRGEMVVDFCAGAGGKTLAIGAAMRNSGRLYAFDTSAHRLEAMKDRLARSGLSNVHPVAIAHERDDRIKRLAGKIDRVLVDAPCSGLGTLRRNPDLKWRQSPQTVGELATLQSAILKSAARLVKPGGRLIYATCSLLLQENEAVAEAFSAENPGFDALAVGDLLSLLKVPSVPGADGDGNAVDGQAPGHSLCGGGENRQKYLRLWPHRHQTDGFFAAVWQKL